jgi:COP9 signalosome complex subunit 3
MGLAKQVLASMTKKNIQRLTKTFITLSLTDVASRVQLSGPIDAECLILNMIEDGEIFATINQKDGMVVFKEDPENYNSPKMLQRLRKEVAKKLMDDDDVTKLIFLISQMTTCMELDRKIQGMEEEILVNPQFVKKAGIGAEDEIPPPAVAQTSKASTSGSSANAYSV